MEAKAFTVKNVRPLFFKKNGLPHKEKLISVNGAAKELNYEWPNDKYKKRYEKQKASTVMNIVRKDLIESHVLCIASNKDGETVYGLTDDKEHIKNSYLRDKSRAKNTAIYFNQKKALTGEILSIEEMK